jgi:hypothetical protein
MQPLRGQLTADHPAAAMFDRCSPCCVASAAEASPFLVCPACGLWLLRCPACRGAVSASGWCGSCLDLRLRWPERIDLDAGGSCDVPIEVLLASASRVEVHALAVRSGANEARAELRSMPLQTGGAAAALLHLGFPAHGEFALRASVEFSWALGSRLVGAVQAPGVVRVRPPRHGHVVNISGTGNLVAGGTGAGIFGLGDESGPSGVSLSQAMAPVQPAPVGGDHFVSWRTRLMVPDLLDGGAPIELVQALGHGVSMGRNRPTEPVEPLAGPKEAALRFPGVLPQARESSQALSRVHWRLFASAGAWQLEQLGQRPTMVRTPGQANVTLGQGQRIGLVAGSQLVVAAAVGGAPLVLTLRHRQSSGGHVLRSELVLGHGG